MIRKIYSRNVFVIEVSQADNVIGYYAGKDKNYSIVVKSLNDAMVIKTEKGIRHILTNLDINYGTDYSFKVVEAVENQSTFYYDEYDNVKKLKPVYIIKVKEKSDALSEPSYISDVDFKEGSFKHSYAIEKAMQLGENRSYKTYRFLVERFSEKYDFYQETIFVKKERTIELRDE